MVATAVKINHYLQVILYIYIYTQQKSNTAEQTMKIHSDILKKLVNINNNNNNDNNSNIK